MLLGLDIATMTGFCHGRGDCLPVIGSFRLGQHGQDIGAFLSEFEIVLARLLTEVEPEVVVFEAPAPSPKNPPITTRKLQGLAGLAEMVCHRRNIPIYEAAPATVKKALAGHGHAKKDAMVAACRAYGLTPKTYVRDGLEASDEADAFGVWLCAVRRFRPEQAERWDPINFIGRAA